MGEGGGGAALSFKICRFKQQKWFQGCVGDDRHPFLSAMLCGRLQLRACLKRKAQRLRAKAELVNTRADKWLSDPQAAGTSSGFPMSFPYHLPKQLIMVDTRHRHCTRGLSLVIMVTGQQWPSSIERNE